MSELRSIELTGANGIKVAINESPFPDGNLRKLEVRLNTHIIAPVIDSSYLTACFADKSYSDEYRRRALREAVRCIGREVEGRILNLLHEGRQID